MQPEQFNLIFINLTYKNNIRIFSYYFIIKNMTDMAIDSNVNLNFNYPTKEIIWN